MRHPAICMAFSALAVVLAIGTTEASAAQKAKPQLVALDTTASEIRRSVFSGNELQIGQLYTINPDCSSGSLVDVRIVKRPSHGDISLQEIRSVVELKREYVRARCNGKSVDAVGVFYTSKADFTGTDRMQLEVDYKNGLVRRYSIIVHVR